MKNKTKTLCVQDIIIMENRRYEFNKVKKDFKWIILLIAMTITVLVVF